MSERLLIIVGHLKAAVPDSANLGRLGCGYGGPLWVDSGGSVVSLTYPPRLQKRALPNGGDRPAAAAKGLAPRALARSTRPAGTRPGDRAVGYRDDNRRKTLTLPAEEFIRRLSQRARQCNRPPNTLSSQQLSARSDSRSGILLATVPFRSGDVR